MTRRVGRLALVGALVLWLASNSLGPVLSGGSFETSMPASNLVSSGLPVGVSVTDRTGLVEAAFGAQAWPDRFASTDRFLQFSWLGGCADRHFWLTLRRVGDGYAADLRDFSFGCAFMIGIPRTVTLVTRVPIDPTTVAFDALDAAVR